MPDTIDYKTWVYEEAARDGVTPGAIQMRVSRGLYVGLERHHRNRQALTVALPAPAPRTRKMPRGALPMRDWVKAEAARFGVSMSAIWMRLNRGKYAHMEHMFGGVGRRSYVIYT